MSKKRFEGTVRFLLLFVALLITGCGGGGSSGNGNNSDATADTIVSDKAIVINDQEAIQALDSNSLESNELVFFGSPTSLNDIKSGDILVVGETEKTPNGLLRKVIEKREENGDTVLVTVQSALTEVIQKGSINLSGTIQAPQQTASAVQAKGSIYTKSALKGVNIYTTRALAATGIDGCSTESLDFIVSIDSELADQLVVNGCIGFSIDYDLDLDIDDWKLQSMRFAITPTESYELSLSSETELTNFEKEVILATYQLPSIKFVIGIVPVVIVPEIDIVLGVSGSISVNLVTGASSELSATVGMQYNSGSWSAIADRSTEFAFIPPTVSADAEATVYVGPSLEMLFYGVAGPEASLQGYVMLQADVLADPWWQLYGGIRAGAAVSVEILDNTIASASIPDIIDYQIKLAEAEAGLISQGLSVSITPPSGGTTFPIGEQFKLQGEVSGGIPPYIYEWSDGFQILSTSEDSGLVWGDTMRTEIMTFTVTDSAGETANDSIAITFVRNDQYEQCQNSLLFETGNISFEYDGVGNDIVHINTTTGEITKIAYINASGIFMTRADRQNCYYHLMMGDNYSLFSVNLVTGNVSEFRLGGAQQHWPFDIYKNNVVIGAALITPVDYRLCGNGAVCEVKVFSVEIDTGKITNIATITGGLPRQFGMFVDSANDTATYVGSIFDDSSSASQNTEYTINLLNGVVSTRSLN